MVWHMAYDRLSYADASDDFYSVDFSVEIGSKQFRPSTCMWTMRLHILINFFLLVWQLKLNLTGIYSQEASITQGA